MSIDRISLKGGTRTAVSAKLILSAKANGIRKNINKYNNGGRMMNHLPLRCSQGRWDFFNWGAFFYECR